MRGDQLKIARVEQVVHGGDGLLRLEGKVGFVSGVLPGELVSFVITQERPRQFWGLLREVLEPSPSRCEPRCPLAGRCGGCDWQHASYDHQLEMKRDVVAEDFARIGKFSIDRSVISVLSGEPWGYRERVQVHTNSRGLPGFKARRSGEIISVSNCPVAAAEINCFLDGVARGDVALPPERRVSLALADRGASGDRDVITALEKKEAQRTLGGVSFSFDPSSFFQVNRDLLECLAHDLRARIAKDSPRVLVDLYAGAGVLGALAVSGEGDFAGNVLCVEADRRNARFIKENLLRAGLAAHQISVIPQTAERAVATRKFLAHVDPATVAVILDPPRAGLSGELRRWLRKGRFSRLFYLSCNSSTLARDLGELTDTYMIQDVTILDFFPQTAHIEVFVELRLGKS
ncbi:class I SAM-dependent RNA methyltransferase [Alkalispirochaeta americana]|uniref:class I SAM-dependent RNA methyltransferase n=1 Tax=Alkalispirochaeta americana TaxID=159291 RepID=UPI000970F560|nr:RsmD family RNA methyltransferase [Alkalispirochaeta americana]